MRNRTEILEALEATTQSRNADRATANRRDTLNWRDTLLKFLDEIDGDITVSEIRDAFEDF